MTENLQRALTDTLTALITLSHDGARPPEALARLQSVRERHPETPVDLVWEEEAYDGAVHYDALLQLPDSGTVALSYCADRGLPWPLRGVHRWSDADLVRVNATILKVDQAIGCLDFLWEDRRLMDRLVNVCLIEEELSRDPIDLSSEELQQAMDGFRRAHRLYTAEATHRWMERRGMTHEQLEKYAGDEALVARLRHRVTDADVPAHFAAHRADFDSARVARIDFTDEGDAHRVYEQIRAGEVGFFEAARRRFLEADTPRDGTIGSLFTILRRGEAPAALAAAVFGAAPNDVVGPAPIEDGFVVALVLDLTPACLDEPVRTAIARLLFDQWLEERRRSARIAWNWGNAIRAADEAPDAVA